MISMRTQIAGLLVAALVAFTGCNKGTPGGPGATNPNAKKPVVGQANDTFTLSVPTLSTTLKQGDTKTVAISINRGKNLDEDVTLKFADVPTGLTIEPASPTIKRGDTEAKLTLKAADNAALGDFTIKVTGHPTNGADASNEFKVTVAKK
jgi:uncharacterized membrane protein